MKKIINKVLHYVHYKYATKLHKRILEIEKCNSEYLYLDSEQKIYDWVNSPCNKVIIEADSTYVYNDKNQYDAIAAYCGYIHFYINNFLRIGDSKFDFSKMYIDKIDEVMLKGQVSDDVIAVRWVYMYDRILNLKVGDVHCEKSYLSTSLLLSYIGKHDTENQRDITKCALLIIKIPKGTKAIYVEHISMRGEYELLIDKGMCLKIERIYNKLFRPYIIICKIASNN